MTLPITFDHCVMHVADWERSNAFYRDVLGAELVRRRRAGPTVSDRRSSICTGRAFHPAEVARLPVQPGNSDLCFEWNGPIADAVAHLGRCGVSIDAGPMERFGAKGAGTSVYFRDPDGSLLEFISYRRKLETVDDERARSECAADRSSGAAGRRRRASSHGIESFLRCRSPATDGSTRRPVEARRPHGRLHLSAHRRARTAPCRTAGTLFPARAAARRSRARFAITSPSSSSSASPHLYGLSTQDTAYQSEAVERLHAAVPVALGRRARARARDRAADLHGRRHDAAQAHDAGDRRRRRSARCSIRSSRRTRTPRRSIAWLQASR